MNAGNILNAIYQWAQEFREEILEVYLQRGGWEGWAQAEIARYLVRTFGDGPAVQRETPGVYPDRRHPDITIKSDAGVFVIELKCESINSGIKYFQENLLDDYFKINDIESSCKALVIGFSVSKQCFLEMEELRKTLPGFKDLQPSSEISLGHDSFDSFFGIVMYSWSVSVGMSTGLGTADPGPSFSMEAGRRDGRSGMEAAVATESSVPIRAEGTAPQTMAHTDSFTVLKENDSIIIKFRR